MIKKKTFPVEAVAEMSGATVEKVNLLVSSRVVAPDSVLGFSAEGAVVVILLCEAIKSTKDPIGRETLLHIASNVHHELDSDKVGDDTMYQSDLKWFQEFTNGEPSTRNDNWFSFPIGAVLKRVRGLQG